MLPIVVMGIAVVLSLAQGSATQRGVQTSDTSREVPSSPVTQGTVHFQVEGMNPSGWYNLAPGSALRSGDKLRIKVKVNTPQFLYVLQFFSDGGARVLYPEQGHHQIVPGRETLLPGEGKVLVLDNFPGIEHIYLLASSRPIHEVDQQVGTLVKGIQNSPGSPPQGSVSSTSTPAPSIQVSPQSKTGEAPAPSAPRKKPSEKRPPPPPSVPAEVTTTLASRGMVVASAAGDQGITLKSDPDGVVVYHFELEHLP